MTQKGDCDLGDKERTGQPKIFKPRTQALLHGDQCQILNDSLRTFDNDGSGLKKTRVYTN